MLEFGSIRQYLAFPGKISGIYIYKKMSALMWLRAYNNDSACN